MIIRTNKQIDTPHPLIDNIRTLQRSLAVQRDVLNARRTTYVMARAATALCNKGTNISTMDRGSWLNECKRTKRALREQCATIVTLLEALRESRHELLLAMPVEHFANTRVRMIEPREVRYSCQNSAFKYGGTA